jgi:hypothetical protein
MKERDWKDDPRLQAAAFEGLASNPSYSDVDRLEFAYKAIEWLHKALDEADDTIASE